MIISIVNGQFYQAFRYNPLLFITFPFFIFFLTDLLISKLMKRKPLYSYIPKKIWCILLIIFLTYGIIRNIDMFKYLRPTKI